MVQKSNLHLKHWGINTVLLSPLLPRKNIHPCLHWGEIKKENHIWNKIYNRGGNVRLSCSENNISCYSTNEHQNRGRIEIENYISLFFHLTSCWDSAALILLVMLGAKQLQWINKIIHLDMPVNLIILEQGEGLWNWTTAIELTEAKTQEGMDPEHNSFFKQIFLFFFATYGRFCSSALEGDISYVLAAKNDHSL